MAEKDVSAAVFSGKVTQVWLERGWWLSKAALRFGHPGFANKARVAAERFKELRGGETTEMFELSSLLSGAARNKELLGRVSGDEKQAWFDYYTNRDLAEQDLWFKLRWGETLRAFGAKGTAGAEPEWIPVQAWYWLDPDPVNRDVVRGEGVAYWYVRVVDPRLYSDHPASTLPVLGLKVAKVRPVQSDVNAWMQSYYQQARADGEPPPKRAEQAFPNCANAIGATDRQMRIAMQTVQSDLKRARGGQYRK